MELVEQINAHAYLYLAEIGEPEDNVLRLVIEEARASSEPEEMKIGDVVLAGARPIISDDTCYAYEVLFGSYVAYSVRNESYTPEDKSEEYVGRLFRVYSKSHFLDYVRTATFASDEYPGKLNHYEIVCENHILDVVSVGEPDITIVRRARQRHAPDCGHEDSHVN
ncbi:MAG: hypothetical protein JOZ96_08805 [Acidobacteria bacterium]|nr:hypothetical protein [Acidobacteriota bacterium]